jgi:hypothetical protein
VDTPFPGVQHIHRVTSNQNIHVMKVDLCAPGVSVRTTAYGERGRTVSSFGSLVGAKFAVNGDFFDESGSFATDGLAMHAGQLWPGSHDHGYVAPLAFGNHRVILPRHDEITAVEPWMQEIASGHPSLIFNGAPVAGNNGDPLCTNRNPRTAVGLSQDKRTLIVAVVDGRSTSRIGMTCDELTALMGEMGAYDARNSDGGGSTDMWMAGVGVLNNPSDGVERAVGNHLSVLASGSGDAPMCPGVTPRGALDSASCDGIAGWVQDPDLGEGASQVQLVLDGDLGMGASYTPVTASQHRDDLCTAIGTCPHGFNAPVPGYFRDSKPHTVAAYGIDNYGNWEPLLGGSPKNFQCDPLAPPDDAGKAVRRWIPDIPSLVAWHLSLYDLEKPGNSIVDSYRDGDDLPEKPDLVQVSGDPAIYVREGMRLRHVVDPDSMEAWKFTSGDVQMIDMATFATLHVGAPWPKAPYVMMHEGAQNDMSDPNKAYVLDVANPDDPNASLDADASGGCAAAGGGARWAGLLALLGLVALARPRRTSAAARPGRRARAARTCGRS